MSNNPAPEVYGFQAEISQLMDLIGEYSASEAPEEEAGRVDLLPITSQNTSFDAASSS
jgi:hypothetical protein